ncbi:MAG: hypothetical protein EZS28_016333, partial [Streblomastix strix]
HVLTGSYSNRFLVYDREGKMDAAIEASRVLPQRKPRKVAATSGAAAASAAKGAAAADNPMIAEPLTADSVDLNRKIVKLAWHPKLNILALAACSNLFLYADQAINL